jgi:hypothetical protein
MTQQEFLKFFLGKAAEKKENNLTADKFLFTRD